MKRICVDTGFLIALYDETDEHHERAKWHYSTILEVPRSTLHIPWPILYESVKSEMVKKRRRIDLFYQDWEKLRIQCRLILLNDTEFREKALMECFEETQREPSKQYRELSLADRVIRIMLSEIIPKIDVFITYNSGDFTDICGRLGIQLVGELEFLELSRK